MVNISIQVSICFMFSPLDRQPSQGAAAASTFLKDVGIRMLSSLSLSDENRHTELRRKE